MKCKNCKIKHEEWALHDDWTEGGTSPIAEIIVKIYRCKLCLAKIRCEYKLIDVQYLEVIS